MTHADLCARIRAHLESSKEKPTNLGWRIADDPTLIRKVLAGRKVRPAMEQRILDAITPRQTPPT